MISNKVNPETDRAYTSWSEYSPPGAGDLTLAETYNFSDPLFINGSFQGFAPFGYLDNAIQSSYTTPFAPENIIILTDGQCASACNIFLEAMVTDGGVRTVVAGGRPEPGPMQAGSGTRSAVTYSADQLATDFEVAGVLDETAISLLPQDYATDVITRYLGVSLRQQVRRDDPTPLQFRYLAADCRIYYTMANWNNFTRLYLDVDTIFDSPSLCVAGSTGYARRGTSQPDNPPPRRRSPMGSYIAGGLQPQTPLNSPASPFTPIEAEVDPSLAGLVLACNSDSQCDTGYKRVFWNRTCSSQPVRVCGCLPKCNYYAGGAQSDECETDAPCQRDAAQSGKGNAAVNFDGYSSSTSSEQGRCKPNDRYIASVTCGSTPPPDDPPSPVYSKVKDTKAKKKTTKKCRGQGCVRRV
ncbi:Hypothetical protein D9617_18g034480 [Elsinoe fawcettii]|nr:Hypothetical protein D9617_18g034480 [Elsinoe fawcettii]